MKEGAKSLSGWQIGAIWIFSAALVFLPFAVFSIRQLPARKLGEQIGSLQVGCLGIILGGVYLANKEFPCPPKGET